MSIIEFNDMLDVEVEQYERILKAYYIRKIINLQFLCESDDVTKANLKRINDWYKKEIYKCQCAKN